MCSDLTRAHNARTQIQEGRALAQSQSDMERTVRRVRADLRKVTEERDKARTETAALNEKLALSAVQLIEAKNQAKSASKSVSALAAAEKEVRMLISVRECASMHLFMS